MLFFIAGMLIGRESRIMESEYFVVDLEQGSKEWIEWRHKGIGASDASTVMGQNRFQSSSNLLREKQGPVTFNFYQNDRMALGTRLEPEARSLYISTTGNGVEPVCIQSSRYEWFRASLDGLTSNGDVVVEIKCGASAYRRVSEFRAVPDYYYGQVQHILAITGLDTLDFWCYWPGSPAILLPVKRNDEYIEKLIQRESEFWDLVTQN
jgi:putative phage-type endonuclease